MEASKILTSDVLDILFEHMNKDYGAYKLRKEYNSRLRLALIITGLMTLFLTGGIWASHLFADVNINHGPRGIDLNLTAVKDPAPPPLPPPPPPPHIDPPRIQIDRVTPPRIVEQPDPNRQVHPQDELDNVAIGPIEQTGIKDPGAVNPPRVDVDSRVISRPVDDDSQRTFIKVEREAQFPGGDAAWHEYVLREMNQHMDELQEDGRSGTCEVQFIVDKEGVVSDVKALTMDGSKLAEIAVNAIRRGPRWVPAEQNGRMVKAYRQQKITFELPAQ